MVVAYLDAIAPVRPLRESEIQTHEGGIAREASTWTRLRRFLILGSEGGNFYTPERDLTIENVGVVRACAAEDAARTIGEIVTISESGRAPKNEPAILALAMLSLDERDLARRLAFGNLTRVCRTGTHILHFAAYREALGGGWGRGMRTAVGKWFTEKSPRDLAYQAVKYPSRDGWALADLLRLAHPKMDETHSQVAKYIVDGDPYGESNLLDPGVFLMWAQVLKNPEGRDVTREEMARIIREERMPRETLATELLNDPTIWDALLVDMPMTAMIRNLGKMTSVGLLTAGSAAEHTIVDRLLDSERLRKARVHPISILNALRVYEQGRGEKGSLTWTPSKRVVNALDEAFYLAFGTVQPTGKRMRLALDVSGSMDGSKVVGMNLSAREASAALALVTLAVEPDAHVVAYSHELVGVNLRPSMRLDEVLRVLRGIPMGGTYCSLPIQQATAAGASVDLFVSYTDSETWNGGQRHFSPSDGYANLSQTASEALHEYRVRSGIEARHAVVAMSANHFSIADSNDPGQLDIAGCDAATPQILSDFALGLV